MGLRSPAKKLWRVRLLCRCGKGERCATRLVCRDAMRCRVRSGALLLLLLLLLALLRVRQAGQETDRKMLFSAGPRRHLMGCLGQ